MLDFHVSVSVFLIEIKCMVILQLHCTLWMYLILVLV